MRMRTIKPEFWSSEGLAMVDPLARLTFIGLWNLADDYGVGKANPKLVSAALYPLDSDSHVDEWMDQLEAAGLIWRYEVEGRWYYAVPSWEKHQAAAYRRGERQHPAPPDVQPAREDVQVRAGTGNREQGREQGTTRAAELRGEFESFWIEYPRKLSKGAAERAYAKARKSAEASAILAGLRRVIDTEWSRRPPDKVPYASTWLNAQGWLDEPTAAADAVSQALRALRDFQEEPA